MVGVAAGVSVFHRSQYIIVTIAFARERQPCLFAMCATEVVVTRRGRAIRQPPQI